MGTNGCQVAFVNALNKTGTRQIEVTAFVSPKWVPQLKDAREVLGRIERSEGIEYSALVPNLRGFERAMECDVDKLALFTAASETFNSKNINTTIDGSFERMKRVCDAASVQKDRFVVIFQPRFIVRSKAQSSHSSSPILLSDFSTWAFTMSQLVIRSERQTSMK